MAKWQWWWQDKTEMEIWRKLNTIPVEDRKTSQYKDLIDEKIEKYGNIYFFKPHEQCEAFMMDEQKIKILHGNNGSGKSYHAGADFCYELMGWSPYRNVQKAKFDRKVLWVFCPTQKTQRESAQVVLFSIGDKAIERDIGLLPKLEVLESYGCSILWENKQKKILDSIEFPDGTIMYFKTLEMSLLSISAAPVDFIWNDELPPASKFDEGVTRVIRKDGSVIMSCLVESAEDSYLVQDLHTKYENDKKNGIHTDFSFHFITIEGNKALDIKDLESRKRNVSAGGAEWRFSKEGKFNLNPKGTRVWGNFFYDTHACYDTLFDDYDPMKSIVCVWDIGRYAIIGLQSTEWGDINYLFSIYREQVQLPNMIEYLNAYINNHFRDVLGELHVLPHDANRTTKITRSPTSTTSLFRDEYNKQVEVIYVDAESSYRIGNKLLKDMGERGKPKLKFDTRHCTELINALLLHTYNEKGKPKDVKMTKDLSDAFKLSISFIQKYRRSGYRSHTNSNRLVNVTEMEGRNSLVEIDPGIRYGRIFGNRRLR